MSVKDDKNEVINSMQDGSMESRRELEAHLDKQLDLIAKKDGLEISAQAFENDDINVRIQTKWHALASAQSIHREELEEASVESVVKRFNIFLRSYKLFREANGLDGSGNYLAEGMADKLGRICRQIKHKERNDPKDNWPEGLTGGITGLLVYMIMALEKYDLDITEGMANELQAAVDQHGTKEKEGTNNVN